jgi:hypothetical protein
MQCKVVANSYFLLARRNYDYVACWHNRNHVPALGKLTAEEVKYLDAVNELREGNFI